MYQKYRRFSNEKFKFSIDYPYDWVVKEEAMSNSITFSATEDYMENLDKNTAAQLKKDKVIFPSIVITVTSVYIKNLNMNNFCDDTLNNLRENLYDLDIEKKRMYLWDESYCAEIIYNGVTMQGFKVRGMQWAVEVENKLFYLNFSSSKYDFHMILKDFYDIRNSFVVDKIISAYGEKGLNIDKNCKDLTSTFCS